MKKAEKRFRLYAILVIFALLTLLLAAINGANFTMAAQDADRLTQMLADRQGSFGRDEDPRVSSERPERPTGSEATEGKYFRMGPMGPDSPEMNASLRYFTVAFNNGEDPRIVAFSISAVTQDEAASWASGLVNEKTGWTRGSYRFRVYNKGEVTFVTVIDQGRELHPSYRILTISAVGEALVLLIGWFVLLAIGRKIYAPIEEADRKQKNFIKNANSQFRVPLTVISADTELLERKYGPDDHTRSTRRQLTKLGELVGGLDTMGIFDDPGSFSVEVALYEYLFAALDSAEADFAARSLAVTTDVQHDIRINADPDAMKRLVDEIVLNAVKFSVSRAGFTLKKQNGYVVFEEKNDTDLPDGPADQIFDRFTTLSGSRFGEQGAGLGLAFVKETVRAHNGRVSAWVTGGTFTLRITL